MNLSLVTYDSTYKHTRGCVTPKQIENLNKAIEGDYDYLDGYEELPEDVQERVRQAIDDGHIADEDWTGVKIACATVPLRD